MRQQMSAERTNTMKPTTPNNNINPLLNVSFSPYDVQEQEILGIDDNVQNGDYDTRICGRNEKGWGTKTDS